MPFPCSCLVLLGGKLIFEVMLQWGIFGYLKKKKKLSRLLCPLPACTGFKKKKIEKRKKKKELIWSFLGLFRDKPEVTFHSHTHTLA